MVGSRDRGSVRTESVSIGGGGGGGKTEMGAAINLYVSWVRSGVRNVKESNRVAAVMDVLNAGNCSRSSCAHCVASVAM